MEHPLPQTWDLEGIFAGGSSSAAFHEFLEDLGSNIRLLDEALGFWVKPSDAAETATALLSVTEIMQRISLQIREADSFTACLAAANQADRQAVILSGRVRSLAASFESVLTRFDQVLAGIDDVLWKQALESPELSGIAFSLSERRALFAEKLPPELESLAADLAVDGYHGWGELYNTAVSRFKIEYEGEELSAGQAANRLSSADRTVREQVFQLWEQEWAQQADFCAEALNRLAGFRLKLYDRRGWGSVLKEPLAINRMSSDTLNAMWGVIEAAKPVFVEYLERKAKLLGVDKLSWHDVEAPLGQGSRTYSYDEGAELIIRQFRKFSPKLADFSEEAFAKRWIEAEDRPGKRPGGFCTSLPIKGETRIFMTYAGSASNVATLAHELGHAYHQHVMNDLPALAQEYAMNVAETASTFAEMIIADAAVKTAASDEERLTLLEDKIQRSVAFYMNIHARFLFETSFYEERRSGIVSIEKLNELMETAQRTAYRDSLGQVHPLFWASKLHFYITEVPFYNFPYTFGYMFSTGLYAEALQRGTSFEEDYALLLRDTGRMTVEDLAMKHLGVDLRKPDFWQKAMDLTISDVKQFLQMTE